jgi:hypothetical protein
VTLQKNTGDSENETNEISSFSVQGTTLKQQSSFGGTALLKLWNIGSDGELFAFKEF